MTGGRKPWTWGPGGHSLLFVRSNPPGRSTVTTDERQEDRMAYPWSTDLSRRALLR